MSRADEINPAEVNRTLNALTPLPGTRFAGYVMHFPVVDSTNNIARQAAQNGAQRGVWVADQQTAGRGRGGHTWLSTPGDGLYVSILITPRLSPTHALLIALATGLAAKSAIEETCGLEVDIRWPNDMMLHEKKCGGILIETSIETGLPQQKPTLRYAVIGIGINVNHPEFPTELAAIATSLRIETGVKFVRQPLLIALLKAIDHEIHLLEKQYQGILNGPDTRERFTEASTWVRGKRVYVPEQGGYTGTTVGLDFHGSLLVKADDGITRTVISGGVRPFDEGTTNHP
jgi:BirA family biotin operon repressor/biotin-[acetyl-CoA-carboxylase] ligase